MKNWFLDIFAGGMFAGIQDVLSQSLFPGGESEFGKAGEFVQLVYNDFMVPVALSILIIYFCISMMEKTTNEQFTYEQLFLLLAKLVIGIFVIDKGFDILMKLHQLGIAWFNEFVEFAKDNGMALSNDKIAADKLPKHLQDLWKALTGTDWDKGKELTWMQNIKAFFNGGLAIMLGWVVTFIVKIVVYVVAFLRIMEVYVRTMFAPVAFADFFYNGLNSTGFRFLKNYLAISLQILVIYGSLLMYSVVAGSMLVPSGGDISETAFLVMHLGLSAATVGIIFKSQSLIKEFVGAN